tara:strand:- start:176 stop:862 length:687 start_codon:yes stop_codon:yes gene_type:complete
MVYKTINISLPAKGRLRADTLKMFKEKNLTIFSNKGSRDLIAYTKQLKNVKILYLHARESIESLANGTIDLAISGYDLLLESNINIQKKIRVCKKLKFGFANLVLACPKEWIDTQTLLDISEIASDFIKTKKQPIKIATKYDQLVTNFLYEKGITQFEIVKSKGSTEIAPLIGQSNLVADITSTGATLAANNLRVLKDGLILKSCACLMGSKSSLKRKDVMKIVKKIS